MENFRLTESGCLYQWDLNRQLAVNVDCDEVHFAAHGSTEALPVKIHEEDGQRLADIPNILLQEAGTLKVYAYITGEEESYTLLCRDFKVLSRPKPTGYVYTETETLTWESLDRRIEALEESGGAKPEDIKNAVDDYMAKNPETDPTVPEWAKQPTKPTYTAQEVGALPSDTVIPEIPDIPDKLPNPYKLTFTGAVNAEYDGSKEAEVEIPAGGGGGAGWELLADITTAEDTNRISTSVCDDGTPIEEKKYCAIYVDMQIKANTSLDKYNELAFNINGWSAANGAGILSQTLGNTNRNAQCLCLLVGSMAMYFEALHNAGTSVLHRAANKSLEPYITSFAVWHSSLAIPAGSNIKIYGVRL